MEMAYIQAENLKHKRTFTKTLIVLAPFVTALMNLSLIHIFCDFGKSEDFQFAFHILCIGSDKIGHDFRNFLRLSGTRIRVTPPKNEYAWI